MPGDFNARTTIDQAIILSNDSNANPLWLVKDIFWVENTREAPKIWVKICLVMNLSSFAVLKT